MQSVSRHILETPAEKFSLPSSASNFSRLCILQPCPGGDGEGIVLVIIAIVIPGRFLLSLLASNLNVLHFILLFLADAELRQSGI